MGDARGRPRSHLDRDEPERRAQHLAKSKRRAREYRKSHKADDDDNDDDDDDAPSHASGAGGGGGSVHRERDGARDRSTNADRWRRSAAVVWRRCRPSEEEATAGATRASSSGASGSSSPPPAARAARAPPRARASPRGRGRPVRMLFECYSNVVPRRTTIQLTQEEYRASEERAALRATGVSNRTTNARSPSRVASTRAPPHRTTPRGVFGSY